MFSEDNKILNSYNIGLLLLIYLLNMTKNLDLNESLLCEFGLIFNDFQRNFFFILMIESFEDLTIWTFAD
jgi:hypothetical protein